MKKHSMPEMKEGGVNVTPLIDIVMCLIIFFMLVAKIGVTKGRRQGSRSRRRSSARRSKTWATR